MQSQRFPLGRLNLLWGHAETKVRSQGPLHLYEQMQVAMTRGVSWVPGADIASANLSSTWEKGDA